MKLKNRVSFGFEQTFTVSNWWENEGFCNVSDTPLKRQKMLDLATALSKELNATIKESTDIWRNLQYQIIKDEDVLFEVTMDPGCIEVKTKPQYLDNIKAYAETLFIAATKADLYPYRSWWYGANKGTEGGCHVNMGSLSNEDNVFNDNPDLLIKYAAFVHNRPFLAYAFAGADVGEGGNFQRLDEKVDFPRSIILFKNSVKEKFNHLDDVYNYFKESTIITDRSSFPSFRKLASPLNMIEDRAVQSLRSALELELVAKLRITILEYVATRELEPLLKIVDLHGFELTSFKLWNHCINFCNELELNPIDYQCFFDRQFPVMTSGVNVPEKFKVKEGKRPRKILEVYKNEHGEITGKKVDTSFLRLEFYYNTSSEDQYEFSINYPGVETMSETARHGNYLNFGDKGTSYHAYADIKINDESDCITIELKDKLIGDTIEFAKFNLKTMAFE